jgi:ribonuclease Y
MEFTELAVYSLIGLISGAGLVWLLFFLLRKQIINEAREEAQEILLEAQEQFASDEQDRAERVQEIQLEAWSEVEEAHLSLEHRCEELEQKVSDRKTLNEEKYKTLRGSLMLKEIELREISLKLSTKQTELNNRNEALKKIKKELKDSLIAKLGESESDVLETLKVKTIEEADADFKKASQDLIDEVKELSEQKAKKIISICHERFNKEMSTERGILASHFTSEEVRRVFCENLQENIKIIQAASGCDIHIDLNPEPDRWSNIQIVGYDPVRRELTRRIFDRIFRDIEKNKKRFSTADLPKVCDNLKAELLNQIKRDGDLICKELGLQNVNPEIRQVMGSLRFRYSYTQNQYFHCSEVGWFAGLLAAELGHEVKTGAVKKARRAGMLHDLGKALDHELDGSHAVIGADFIAARNEAEDITYAVRAHHHDVTPTHDLDYLVIAADAISGGRPGARRSTVETYTQKVSGLQEISKRFHGVTDVFVLNGGRECRVMVNSRAVDDAGALKISQQIAKTIEDEMQYPGQIKVVVVRETINSESTAGRGKHDR